MYDFSTSDLSSSVEISSWEMYSERMATERSMKEYVLQSDSQLEGSEGIDSGMYNPAFGARPVRTVCAIFY